MAVDAHANFAISAVATAPSPAASGTSLVVTAGQGSRFPATPFNAVIWPIGAIPTPANAEIVRVTARATDTLTITRAQESSGARTVIIGDQIAAAITAKAFTDIEDILLGWTTYTPTVVQSGAITSIQSNSFRYRVIGKTVFVQGRLTINNATGAVAGNLISVSLPVAGPGSLAGPIGMGALIDASAALLYAGQVRLLSTTTVGLLTIRTGTAPLASGGAIYLGAVDFTAVLATGDIIDFYCAYEAA